MVVAVRCDRGCDERGAETSRKLWVWSGLSTNLVAEVVLFPLVLL